MSEFSLSHNRDFSALRWGHEKQVHPRAEMVSRASWILAWLLEKGQHLILRLTNFVVVDNGQKLLR